MNPSSPTHYAAADQAPYALRLEFFRVMHERVAEHFGQGRGSVIDILSRLQRDPAVIANEELKADVDSMLRQISRFEEDITASACYTFGLSSEDVHSMISEHHRRAALT